MSTRGSFPHPVLDDSDDVGSLLEVANLIVAPTMEDVEIRWTLRTDDPDLFAMLDDGRARHSLRWKCGATLSTGEDEPDTVNVDQRNGEMTVRTFIDQENVRHSVDLEMRILAARDITGHRWTKQHPDYGTDSFDIAKGDVLAGGHSARFNPTKLYDPLKPPVGSCFKFERNDSIRKGIRVSFANDQHVVVQLSPDAFDGLGRIGHRADLQISLVVLPALMQTLSFIRDNQQEGEDAENLDDRDWFVAISDLVTSHGGMDGQDFLKLSQKILESPVDRVLATGIGGEDEE